MKIFIQTNMLRFMSDMPGHVVGIHAVGEVTRDDMETVLLPRLDELAAKQGSINYLLILETDVGNFTGGAILADIKAGLKHFTKWNRIAIVTDQKSVAWFSDVFRFFIPGESKGFPLSKLDEAVIWVSEKNKDN